MKKTAIIVFLLIFNILSAKYTYKDIPEKNRAVLQFDEFNMYSKSKTWTPDNNQTQKALMTIYNYLVYYGEKGGDINAKAEDMKKMLSIFETYKVQFVGIYYENNKYIHCNFFTDAGLHFKDWKENYVSVKDGGCNYWRITVNIENGEIKFFHINGNG